jgi:hypothetical protein
MKSVLQPYSPSLVRELYADHSFVDRFLEASEGIDVIIPLLHSNDLWEENLKSFYREIPIRQLIVGDAGCIDSSIQILEKFPRVKIINQKAIKTLGACLADLISEVATERFIYLQSDVYLPTNWYQDMLKGMGDADWVGCPMQLVVITDYRQDYSGLRPLAGAQLGRKEAFSGFQEAIDDDFVYRQEDFVLDGYVKSKGGKSINNLDVFHFHQLMRRNTIGEAMDIKDIRVITNKDNTENQRVNDTQLFGYMKYLDTSNKLASISFKNQLLHELNESKGRIGHIIKFSESKSGWKRLAIKTLFIWYLKNILKPMRDLLFALSPLLLARIILGLLGSRREKI